MKVNIGITLFKIVTLVLLFVIIAAVEVLEIAQYCYN